MRYLPTRQQKARQPQPALHSSQADNVDELVFVHWHWQACSNAPAAGHDYEPCAEEDAPKREQQLLEQAAVLLQVLHLLSPGTGS